jgi:hypothetical protein
VKAILVMDMPSSCMGCNFLHCEIEENKEYCEAREIRKQVDLAKEEKPDWCPLRELPNPKEKGKAENILEIFTNTGYNACIDEILGDKERRNND